MPSAEKDGYPSPKVIDFKVSYDQSIETFLNKHLSFYRSLIAISTI